MTLETLRNLVYLRTMSTKAGINKGTYLGLTGDLKVVRKRRRQVENENLVAQAWRDVGHSLDRMTIAAGTSQRATRTPNR